MTPLALKQVNDERSPRVCLDHLVRMLTQSHRAGTPVTPGGPEPGAELLLLVSAHAGTWWFDLDHTLINSVVAARTHNHFWPRCCQKHGDCSCWRVDLTVTTVLSLVFLFFSGLLTHICICI